MAVARTGEMHPAPRSHTHVIPALPRPALLIIDTLAGPFVRLMSSDEVCEALSHALQPC
ncbi:hypothetical protein [Aeromonas sobria]|uniref:hypothetical protein n=1 Tax=Aeromonas sobria TaxID=646 RepID=UPI003CFF3606